MLNATLVLVFEEQSTRLLTRNFPLVYINILIYTEIIKGVNVRIFSDINRNNIV